MKPIGVHCRERVSSMKEEGIDIACCRRIMNTDDSCGNNNNEEEEDE